MPHTQSKIDGYMFFKPPPAKTPALRAKLVDPEQPYNFVVPATGKWKARVAPPREVGAAMALLLRALSDSQRLLRTACGWAVK